MPGALQPLGVDDRMPLGLDQLGLEPHRGQVVAHPDGGPARVGVVVGLGADARDADQRLELLQEIASMRVQIFLDTRHIHCRLASRSPCCRMRDAPVKHPGQGEDQYNICDQRALRIGDARQVGASWLQGIAGVLLSFRINKSRFFDRRACAAWVQTLTKCWRKDCTVDFSF